MTMTKMLMIASRVDGLGSCASCRRWGCIHSLLKFKVVSIEVGFWSGEGRGWGGRNWVELLLSLNKYNGFLFILRMMTWNLLFKRSPSVSHLDSNDINMSSKIIMQCFGCHTKVNNKNGHRAFVSRLTHVWTVVHYDRQSCIYCEE